MDDLALALRLADRADELTSGRFGAASLGVRTKADRSLVTEVDTAVEAVLRELLAEHRPDDAVLGEEGGGADEPAGRQWILDPLDHTNNYARGVPVFATLIALRSGPSVELGVVSAPLLGRRWWAARGQGAFADGRPIRVSDVADLDEAYLSFAALHRWERLGRVPGLVRLAEEVRSEYGGGGFWAQMLVAEGAMDVALDPWGEVWDLAPVQVIVEEAGGRFTDLDGRPRVDRRSAVVSNGLLHNVVLDLLAGEHPAPELS